MNIDDVRHPVQHHLFIGKKQCGDHRQCGVFVSTDSNFPLYRIAAPDPQTLHYKKTPRFYVFKLLLFFCMFFPAFSRLNAVQKTTARHKINDVFKKIHHQLEKNVKMLYFLYKVKEITTLHHPKDFRVTMTDGKESPMWRRLFDIDDRLRKLGPPPPNCEIFKLTISQLLLLKQLYIMRSRGGVTLKELAQVHGVTPATASEMVDSLVKKNVIVRTDNPADRRSILLRPADQWLEYFENYENQLSKITDGFFSSLPEEKKQTLRELLVSMEDFLTAKEAENEKEVGK